MAATGDPATEEGQAHIAATCIAFVVFFIALFFFVQVCWVGFQSLSFNHAIYQTSWELDQRALDEIKVSGDADDYVREAIVADWTWIDPAALDVKDSTCAVNAETSICDLASKNDNETLLIERATHTLTTARIKATATLRVKLLFPVPGIDEVSIVRIIDKAQRISSRFEVS